ncbi:MAG: hypothetical protein GY723_10960 [bacterium]|nr:hypothetical protein [bacterium]MCP5066180.1 hypothetical protein [bacterium]
MSVPKHLDRGLVRRFFVLGLALLLAVAAAAQPERRTPDVPGGDGTIRGRVLESLDGTPLPDVEVALYALTAEGVPGMRRTRSDAEGRFAFEGIARGGNLAYLLGAQYQGVPFPGGRISFTAGETERQADIRIAQLSDDASNLLAGQAELRLQRTGAGLRVTETLRVENPGPNTFHVAAEARKNATPALRARLPEGASSFQMPLGVIPDGVEQTERDLRWWGPVHPGSRDLSFSFELEAAEATDSQRIELSWELPDGASALRLWIPAGAELETPEFSAATLGPGEGSGFLAFDSGPVPPGTRVAISLRVPPARLAEGAVTPTEVRVLLAVDDAAMAVNETHLLEVTGEERVLGTIAAPLHFIPLPAGTARLRFGSDGNGVTLVPDERGGLSVIGETPPGELKVEVAYQVQVDAFPVEFERSWPVSVPLLSIFLTDPGNLSPHSERLHRRRPVRTSDLTYMHLEAYEIEADEKVGLRIDRRPPRSRLPTFAFRGGIALCGALALTLLVTPLWRNRSDGDLAGDTETAAGRERDAVVAALRDLDHDFETGKVEEEDYGTLRNDLRARAIELMREERSPRAPVAAAGRPPTCGECGAVPDTRHRFCAQCGSPLPGDNG